MQGPLLEALLLGMLHGATWFLPVSSSGHVALAHLLFDLGTEDSGLRAALAGGVLVATVWVLRRRLRELFMPRATSRLGPYRPWSGGAHDFWFVAVATLPTAALAIVLRQPGDAWSGAPLAVGVGLAVTAAVLLSSPWAGRGHIEFPGWGTALLLGLGQGLTTLPGVSLTGVTIGLALWFGVQRDRAFELTLLVSLPLLAGSLLWDLVQAITSSSSPAPALLAGMAAAFTGVPAARLLHEVVAREWLPWFALWLAPLAVATLALARAWPGP